MGKALQRRRDLYPSLLPTMALGDLHLYRLIQNCIKAYCKDGKKPLDSLPSSNYQTVLLLGPSKEPLFFFTSKNHRVHFAGNDFQCVTKPSERTGDFLKNSRTCVQEFWALNCCNQHDTGEAEGSRAANQAVLGFIEKVVDVLRQTTPNDEDNQDTDKGSPEPLAFQDSYELVFDLDYVFAKPLADRAMCKHKILPRVSNENQRLCLEGHPL